MANLIEKNMESISPVSNELIANGCRSSQSSSARDRLLAALKTSPALRKEDADLIDSAVKSAREESLS